ncbi:MAG: hypothetical protein ACK514_18010 [Bacteroidota bacterium]|jgi:hypothetical protein|nr:hypothetical protein [Cytophagales bacterium]MCZ8069727.1 hypothetical protein [Cytophagales bacterium]
MNLKKPHLFSGSIISVFIALHLFNHGYSIVSANKHIELMRTLRLFYRHVVVESILLMAIGIQIYSGLKLINAKRHSASTLYQKLHVWTGLYLAFFFVIHLSAVFVGRFILHLDTNFYFGVAGLNSFPANLFFIPYYVLAILSFFGHVASIHSQKMTKQIVGLTPHAQATLILILGVISTVAIFYGLTNHFHGVTIPNEYNILIGK